MAGFRVQVSVGFRETMTKNYLVFEITSQQRKSGTRDYSLQYCLICGND